MLTVVTGASGHVGINLIKALKDSGRPVRALTHKNKSVLSTLDIELVDADILDPASLISAFRGAEVVYHLAAHISILMHDWAKCLDMNILGTRNVMDACRAGGVRRLVHFSTIHALCQHPFDQALDESRPLVSSVRCPPYDRSKAAAEQMVKDAIQSGLDAVIINPTGILGPNDYEPSLFGEALINMALGRYPILVDGGFNWVDVRDVVAGAMMAEQTAPAGSNYLLSGHYVTVKDMAGMASAMLGKRAPALICPMGPARFCAPLVTGYARMTGRRPLFTSASLNALVCNRHISHARATREIGYHPRPIKETVHDTLLWFRDNGYLKDA